MCVLPPCGHHVLKVRQREGRESEKQREKEREGEEEKERESRRESKGEREAVRSADPQAIVSKPKQGKSLQNKKGTHTCLCLAYAP